MLCGPEASFQVTVTVTSASFEFEPLGLGIIFMVLEKIDGLR